MTTRETQTSNLRPIPILTYHHVDNLPPRGHPFRRYYVTQKTFSKQMSLLRRLGFQGLSMTHLMPYLNGERQGRVFGITFDDGYYNTLANALPVLKDNGFSSTCYVVSGLVGKTNEWDNDGKLPPQPLMDGEHLREWIASGQDVGAHSKNHVRLNEVEDQVSQQEIELCKLELEALIQAPVNHFCYPYGAHDQRHHVMVSKAGYQTATTLERGRCGANTDMMVLPRAIVLSSTSMLELYLKVATPYQDGSRLKSLIRTLNPLTKPAANTVQSHSFVAMKSAPQAAIEKPP